MVVRAAESGKVGAGILESEDRSTGWSIRCVLLSNEIAVGGKLVVVKEESREEMSEKEISEHCGVCRELEASPVKAGLEEVEAGMEEGVEAHEVVEDWSSEEMGTLTNLSTGTMPPSLTKALACSLV